MTEQTDAGQLFPAYSLGFKNLQAVCAFELLEYFRLKPQQAAYQTLAWLISPLTRLLAKRAECIECALMREGLQAAARRMIPPATRLEVRGAENIPVGEPLLVVSNHPGGVDFFSVLAHLPRPDAVILANDRPIFHYLPAVRERAILISRRLEERISAIRIATRMLREGRAVVVFGSGTTDPDPALLPGMMAAIREQWTSSLGLFLSRVPQTWLAPVFIRGMISPAAWNSLVARLAKTPKRRQQYAALLQVLMQQIRPQAYPLTARLDFCPPRQLAEEDGDRDPRRLQERVIEYLLNCFNDLPALPQSGSQGR